MQADDNLEAFMRRLESIAWFSNVGNDTDQPYARRIENWDDWEGPESPSVSELAIRLQELRDALMSNEDASLRELWDRTSALVFNRARDAVPYDDAEDVWYGPNAAVWQATWTASLIALHLQIRREVPRDLKLQWQSYESGHWPCDWEGDLLDGLPIIY
jgi:hypothetical protein